MVMHRHIYTRNPKTGRIAQLVDAKMRLTDVIALLYLRPSRLLRFLRRSYGCVSRGILCVCAGLILTACGGSSSTQSTTDGATVGVVSSGMVDDPVGSSVSPNELSTGGAGASDSSAGDTSGANGSDSAGATTNPDQIGENDTIPTTPQPMAIRLRTLEEVSIDGSFELFGEASGIEFEQQRFSVITQPRSGAVIHASGARQFTYAPEEDFFGEDDFIYSIGPGLAARVTIEVVNVNDPPIIFDDVQRVIEQGRTYAERLIARDPDNEPLVFTAENLPPWLTLNASSGLLFGTPMQESVGLFENISFRVTDGAGATSVVSGISIEVLDINDAPTINVDQFPTTLDAGDAVSVNLYPDDPDGDLVRLSVETNDFVDLRVNGGTVEVVATEVTEVTEVNLVVRATDLLGHVVREIIPLTIYPVNASGRGRTIRGRSSGEGIHLVVLGDGYRADQQKQFKQHVEDLLAEMATDIGMQTHLSAWNVHMVETPSVDSGIDDNHGEDIRDTYFNTGYFCKQVQRLICGNQSKMFEVAILEYPNFDQIVTLVNDPRYGGGGGSLAIASSHAIAIALHEMGHSIAGLADEYVDRYIPDASIPPYVENRYANVSNSNDPANVPWRHWIDSNQPITGLGSVRDVGIFEGAYYRDSGFYRPTFNSLMRSYEGALGPVNSEQWALSVYSLTNPVLDIAPVSRAINKSAGEVIEFSVVPLFGPDIQLVEWRLDNQLIAHSGGKQPTVALSLPPGQYELALNVEDVSGLIRKEAPHAGIFEWNWTIVVQ